MTPRARRPARNCFGLAIVVVELRQNRQNLDATVELGVSAAYQDTTSRAIENPKLAEVIRGFAMDGASCCPSSRAPGSKRPSFTQAEGAYPDAFLDELRLLRDAR